MTEKKHPAIKIFESLQEEYEGKSLAYCISVKLDIPFMAFVETNAGKAAEKKFYKGYERMRKIGEKLPEKDAKQVNEALNQMESGLIGSQEMAVEEMFNLLAGWYLRSHLRLDV